MHAVYICCPIGCHLNLAAVKNCWMLYFDSIIKITTNLFLPVDVKNTLLGMTRLRFIVEPLNNDLNKYNLLFCMNYFRIFFSYA